MVHTWHARGAETGDRTPPRPPRTPRPRVHRDDQRRANHVVRDDLRSRFSFWNPCVMHMVSRTTATRTDPALWEASKRRACTVAGMCNHSARKMQWAVQDYKRRGGGYVGSRRSSSNGLARWTRQRWRTHSGAPSEGVRRYLPDAAWAKLSPDQVRRTNASKRRGFRRGRQWVRQPADVAAVASKVRRTALKRSSRPSLRRARR